MITEVPQASTSALYIALHCSLVIVVDITVVKLTYVTLDNVASAVKAASMQNLPIIITPPHTANASLPRRGWWQSSTVVVPCALSLVLVPVDTPVQGLVAAVLTE